MESMF